MLLEKGLWQQSEQRAWQAGCGEKCLNHSYMKAAFLYRLSLSGGHHPHMAVEPLAWGWLELRCVGRVKSAYQIFEHTIQYTDDVL